MTDSARDLLEKVQGHLRSGGVVQITTYLRSTVYSKPEHADWFALDGKEQMVVKCGRRRDRLTLRGKPLCGFRFGRFVK